MASNGGVPNGRNSTAPGRQSMANVNARLSHLEDNAAGGAGGDGEGDESESESVDSGTEDATQVLDHLARGMSMRSRRRRRADGDEASRRAPSQSLSPSALPLTDASVRQLSGDESTSNETSRLPGAAPKIRRSVNRFLREVEDDKQMISDEPEEWAPPEHSGSEHGQHLDEFDRALAADEKLAKGEIEPGLEVPPDFPSGLNGPQAYPLTPHAWAQRTAPGQIDAMVALLPSPEQVNALVRFYLVSFPDAACDGVGGMLTLLQFSQMTARGRPGDQLYSSATALSAARRVLGYCSGAHTRQGRALASNDRQG